jgi:hypothetical protein
MNLSSGAAFGRDNCGLIAESLGFGGVETGAIGFLGDSWTNRSYRR